MEINIKPVNNKNDRKAFVQFQFDLYSTDNMWVPMLKADEIKAIDPEQNPAFENCDAIFWTATRGREIVGRIGAIINHNYNKERNEKLGRFSRFECINDLEVARLLLSTACNWLKNKGMTIAMGPLGFNNLDQQGMLIEGHNYLPSIGSAYHMPYYKNLLEELGWEKEIDWVEFRLTLGEQAHEKAMRGAELIKKRYNIEVKHFNNKNEMKPYASKIFEIINESFDVLPFVSKFNPNLIAFYANKYLNLLNPHFVKMTILNGEPIGFIVGMPSLSEAMQKAGGQLFPFGFIHILKARNAKGIDIIDQMLTGVVKEHHATGAAVILQAELQNEMIKHGIKYIETTGIFETNDRAIKNWKNYEHIQHKRRRCFRKSLMI